MGGGGGGGGEVNRARSGGRLEFVSVCVEG